MKRFFLFAIIALFNFMNIQAQIYEYYTTSPNAKYPYYLVFVTQTKVWGVSEAKASTDSDEEIIDYFKMITKNSTPSIYNNAVSTNGLIAYSSYHQNGYFVYEGFTNDFKNVTFWYSDREDKKEYRLIRTIRCTPSNIVKGAEALIPNNTYNNNTPSRKKVTTQDHNVSCKQCYGSGKCRTCNGRHKYINPLTNRYVICPNCAIDGKCKSCGGTGRK